MRNCRVPLLFGESIVLMAQALSLRLGDSLMKRTVEFRMAAGAKGHGSLSGFPDECPRSHTKVLPIALSAVRREGDYGDIEEGFQCTSGRCGRMFIGVYKVDIPAQGGHTAKFSFKQSIPLDFQPPVVEELIAMASPTFVETYGQALAAEGHQLTQLTGIGLRKALEFLVKDFSVRLHPADEEKILKKPLAKCIDDYMNDANLKAVAKRAAWLGNDETHYVRKWEDKDISDLKVLIRLTMNWMDNVLLTEKYVSDMPESK